MKITGELELKTQSVTAIKKEGRWEFNLRSYRSKKDDSYCSDIYRASLFGFKKIIEDGQDILKRMQQIDVGEIPIHVDRLYYISEWSCCLHEETVTAQIPKFLFWKKEVEVCIKCGKY